MLSKSYRGQGCTWEFKLDLGQISGQFKGLQLVLTLLNKIIDILCQTQSVSLTSDLAMFPVHSTLFYHKVELFCFMFGK